MTGSAPRPSVDVLVVGGGPAGASVAASAAWEATAGTVQQASRAYDIAEVRYGAGVSTQLELSDSRLLLQQAEATYGRVPHARRTTDYPPCS